MKKSYILLLIITMSSINTLFAQNYEDDIYYNPKKEKSNKKNSQSFYISNDNLDVDEYNRFGGYCSSKIDTIGNGIANSEDFKYTQEIQKYYNPTIVIDNSEILSDVLANSYGNVNIIYDAGYPVFSSWNYYPYYSSYWPYYNYWNYGWNWGIGWNPYWYDPWYSWGPSWGWSWGWPNYNYPWYVGNTRPSNPRPTTGVRPGWSTSSRPGSAMGNNHRPSVGVASGYRPSTSSRPNSGSGYNFNNHRQPGSSQPARVSNGYRPATGVTNGNSVFNGTTIRGNSGTSNYRSSGSSTNNHRGSSSYNNNRSYNSGSSYRSSGSSRGGFSGGARSGGGSRGTRR